MGSLDDTDTPLDHINLSLDLDLDLGESLVKRLSQQIREL